MSMHFFQSAAKKASKIRILILLCMKRDPPPAQ